MCEKCIEIDKAIDGYRHVVQSILDPITVERAKQQIADLEKRKNTLHPEKG
jgi:hypothetical protein